MADYIKDWLEEQLEKRKLNHPNNYNQCDYKSFIERDSLDVINTKICEYLSILDNYNKGRHEKAFFLMSVFGQIQHLYTIIPNKIEKVNYLLGFQIFLMYRNDKIILTSNGDNWKTTDNAFLNWMGKFKIDKYVYDCGKYFKSHINEYTMQNNQQDNTFENSPNNNINFGNNNSITGDINITINNNEAKQPNIAEREKYLRQYCRKYGFNYNNPRHREYASAAYDDGFPLPSCDFSDEEFSS